MTDQTSSGDAGSPLPEQPGEDPGRRSRRQAPQPRRGVFFPTCLAAGCGTLLAPLAFMACVLLVIALAADSSIFDASAAIDSYSGASTMFRERVVREGDGDQGLIAIVDIQGEITGSGSPFEGSGTLAQTAEQLRAAIENDRVRAVILQIDSPGGGLTPSDMLHNEVLKVRAAGKTVVVWTGSLLASGGYYIASAAEGIMAGPTASVGSIGVIMRRFQVDGLMKTLGLKSDPIMAGSSKDIGSPFRDMTPDERALLQNMVDDAHRRFISVVAKGRGMTEADAANLADGRIFTAGAARENGLVDRVGYMDEAIAWTEELAGRSNMRVVSYRRIFTFADLVGDVRSAAAKASAALSSAAVRYPRLAAEMAE